MSSAEIQLRANENSALFNSIKARSSAVGGRGCDFLYNKEQNSCAFAKQKVEVSPHNNPNYSVNVKYQLPNFGFLNKMYLKTEFGSATNTASTTNLVGLIKHAGIPFKSARLIYQGSEIARISDRYIFARLYSETSGSRVDYLDKMIGGDYDQTHLASGSNGSTSADRDSAHAEERTKGGSAPNDGKQYFYCPLPFFFEETLSRNIDLGALASELYLEVEMRSQAELHSVITTAGKGCPIADQSLICFLNVLHADEERSFRAVSYRPAGTPLTQIGLNTTTHQESNLTYNSTHSIKLNMFSGQVQRLYVFATLYADENSATARKRTIPIALKTIKLKSTGSDIYKMEALSTDNEKYMEWYNTNNPNLPPLEQGVGSRPKTTPVENIYCINFKHGWNNRGSADGSLAFNGLSIPELEVAVETSAGADMSGNSAVSGNFNLHIVSEQLALISYITNANGSTHLRTLTE